MPGIDYRFQFGPRTIFTPRAETWTFFPMTPAMNTANIAKIRAGIKLDLSTGDVELKPGVRYSDDKITWDTNNQVLGNAVLTSNGVDIDDTFEDLPGTKKLYCQGGLLVRNQVGGSTNLECAEGYLRIDTRAC